MNPGEMLVIRVPGSTANLGPGFDSIGLAINLYLTLEVEIADRWVVEMLSDELNAFPKDETNFVIQVAQQIASKYNVCLPPCHIKMKNEIPLTKGLGSSAAAIVAGIELASSIGDIQLSRERKLELAAFIEGHPDNVGASLYGGLVIGHQSEEEVNVVRVKDLQLDILALVPREELLTKAARSVLPGSLSFPESVEAGAISNVLVAALLSKNYQLAWKMMIKDLYHQPYRRNLVPHLGQVEKLALDHDFAFGVAISGAGPTVICFVERDRSAFLRETLEFCFPEMTLYDLEIDQEGSSVVRKNRVN